MKWLVERNRRLGRTSIVSLLLAMVSMAPAVAQDGAFPDLEIVGASFTNTVEPGGSVTVEVTARNAGTVLVMGTETSNSGYMELCFEL